MFLRVLLPAFNDGVMLFETIIEFALRLVGALAMVHIVISISLSVPAIYGFLVKYSGMAFLVFAAHYPTVIVIKSLVGGQALFQTTIGQIVLWFASPVLTVAMIMVFFLLLNIKLQSVVQLLSGQRQVVANG